MLVLVVLVPRRQMRAAETTEDAAGGWCFGAVKGSADSIVSFIGELRDCGAVVPFEWDAEPGGYWCCL